jgi:transposase
MMPGSVCRHLKIAGRVPISRFFHVTASHPKSCNTSPEIATCADLAREFVRIIRLRDSAAWPSWKDCAKSSPLGSFAKHLCHDEAALLAALQQPWSNGPVEGHVHRLKLIKRSMYGRAKFDLLRLRVVNDE